MVTFYTFLQHEKSKWVLMSMKKNPSGLVVKYFERKSTEG